MKRLAGGRLRIGAVKYAVEHLGHDSSLFSDMNACSAVTVAIGRGSAPGDINSLVHDIQPTVAASKGKEGDALANAIHENDAEVADKIRNQAQLSEFAPQVRVVEGYYDLDVRQGGVERKVSPNLKVASLVRPKSSRPLDTEVRGCASKQSGWRIYFTLRQVNKNRRKYRASRNEQMRRRASPDGSEFHYHTPLA